MVNKRVVTNCSTGYKTVQMEASEQNSRATRQFKM